MSAPSRDVGRASEGLLVERLVAGTLTVALPFLSGR